MSPDIYDYDASISEAAQVGDGPKAVIREQSTYMTDRDAEKMCALFADGLDAGIGYARILDFIERQKLDAKMVQRMRHAVLELGDRLGESFARFGILDAASRKLILVAEEQGALPETFKEQSRYFGRRYERRKAFAYSLAEPMILVCLGFFYFRNIFSKIVEATFAPDTWGIMKDAALIATMETGIFCAVTLLLIYAWLNMPVDSSIREAFARIWYQLPFVSKPQRLQAVANFCRYFRQSVRAGMDVHRSLDLAAEASNSPTFMRDVDKAIGVLEAGYPMDQAFSAFKDMPQEVVDYVGIGEETGRIDNQLDFLAKRYDKLTDEASERQMVVRMYMLRMFFVIGIMVLAVFQTILKGGIPIDL